MPNSIKAALLLIIGWLPVTSPAEETADPYIKQAQASYNQALQQARQEEAPMQQQAVAAQANAFTALASPSKATDAKPAPLTPAASSAAKDSSVPAPDNNNNSWTKSNPWANNPPNPWTAPAAKPDQAGAQPGNNQPNAPASTNIYLPPAHK